MAEALQAERALPRFGSRAVVARPALGLGTVVALLSVVAALVPTAAGAAPRPRGIYLSHLGDPPKGVAAGAALSERVVVRNRGRRTARRVRVTLLLSRDRRARRGDLRVAVRPLATLRRAARFTFVIAGPVPSRVRGRYHVVACVGRRGSWRRPGRCKASRARVRVGAAAPAPDAPDPDDGGEPPGRPGGEPPEFAGLSEAVTCLSGPLTPDRTSTYQLSWSAATDDDTPADQIVYEIYQAAAPDQENLSRATYVTKPGATTFTTPPLSAAEVYFFIVRARDRAGQLDPNGVEIDAENICADA